MAKLRWQNRPIRGGPILGPLAQGGQSQHQGFALLALVQRHFVEHRCAQGGFEGGTIAAAFVLVLAAGAQVGLEDASGADRQEVFVGDGIGDELAGGDQGLGIAGIGRRLAAGRGAIAEPGQALAAQFVPVIRQVLEYVGQDGRIIAARCLAALTDLLQQFVVALPPGRGEGHAALFDLTEARGMGALDVALEQDGFFQRLEAGLAQQDGALAPRRTFDGFLGRDAAGGHPGLDGVDVEGARGQVVDVWPLEADHVGDQPMGVVQALVEASVDVGLAMPAEGLQGFLNEGIGFGIC